MSRYARPAAHLSLLSFFYLGAAFDFHMYLFKTCRHTLNLLLKGGGPNFSLYVYELLLAFLTVLQVGDYWFPSTSEEEKKLLALSQNLFPSIQMQCSFQYLSRPTKRHISPYSTVFACPLNIVQVASTLNALSPNDLRGYSLVAQTTWKCKTRWAHYLNFSCRYFWKLTLWLATKIPGRKLLRYGSYQPRARGTEWGQSETDCFFSRISQCSEFGTKLKRSRSNSGGECCSISR